MTKAKRRRKTALPRSAVSLAMPTTWDMGAAGPANRVGLMIEDAGEIDAATGRTVNPNGVLRARRVDMLEVWHRKGQITTAGFNAAERLRDAFEATQRAPGWPDNDRVQSSPKPDHAVTIQIDRMSRFHAIAKLISADDRPIISHCVLDRCIPATLTVRGARPYAGRRYDEGMAALSIALDRLARAMGS